MNWRKVRYGTFENMGVHGILFGEADAIGYEVDYAPMHGGFKVKFLGIELRGISR